MSVHDIWNEVTGTVASDFPDERDEEGTDRSRRGPGARLVQLAGPNPGRVYSLSGPTVIGRDETCDIVVNIADVSRRHVQLAPAPGGRWLVEDLGSKNGTMVDGVPVRQSTITFGGRLHVSQHAMFVFTYRDQLEQQIQQEDRLRALGQLAGGVAHDFSNLLAVVASNVDYLEDRLATFGDEEVGESLRDVRAAATRGAELVRRLTGFAKPSAPEAAGVDVALLAKEVLELCRRTLSAKIRVVQAVEPRLLVRGNQSGLHQVLMNLCINARDAMPDGGVLKLSCERVLLSAASASELPFLSPGPHALIVVSDTGIGMDTGTSARVFEPFFTTKGSDTGTGLGLSTTFAQVRAHGGHIAVTSEVGHGTSFRVYLPLAATQDLVAAHSGVPARSMVRAPEPLPFDRPLVLVVDDDDAVRRGTVRLLECVGFDVCQAPGGQEALDLLERQARPLDLVLLDLEMPDLTGEQTFVLLRKAHSELRILFYTGQRDPKRVSGLLALGAAGVVHKPCTIGELRAAVDAALAEPSGSQLAGAAACARTLR